PTGRQHQVRGPNPRRPTRPALHRQGRVSAVDRRLWLAATPEARAISVQMEPRPQGCPLSHRPMGAVPSERKCAHGRYLLQQAYSVRPIPAGRNMFWGAVMALDIQNLTSTMAAAF